jgi:transcriptional regulator with XRE-family HTH domain
MVLLRHLLGDALRRLRLRQGRTLREVSATARVSLGYLSEVERGRKEASSELLASICDALGAPLSQVLREVSDGFALAELQNEPAFGVPLEPAMAGQAKPEAAPAAEEPAAQSSGAHRQTPVRLPQPAQSQSARSQPARSQPAESVPASAPAPSLPVRAQAGSRLAMPRKLTVRSGQHLAAAEPLLEPVKLAGSEPKFDKLARDVTDMVPV